MDFEKLERVVEELKTDLEKKFPVTKFKLKSYYCGAGYCGINIKIDQYEELAKITKYYDENFNEKFKNRTIQFIQSDVDEGNYNNGEVKIVNKYGECVEALPIFKNM